MAICSGTATRTSSFVACDRIAVLVLLAPKLYLFFLGALYTSFAHLPVVLYLCFRELSILPEDDVEAKAEYAKCHQNQCCKQYLHLVDEARTYLLVVIYLADDVCKHLGHAEDCDLALVLCRIAVKRNSV